MINLTLETKLDIFANRHALNKEPLRDLEKRLNIDKTTLSRKSQDIHDEITSYFNALADPNKLLVARVNALAMIGRSSSRDIASLLKILFGTQIEHDTVLNILNHSGQAAQKIQGEVVSLKNAMTASLDEIFQNQNPLLVFINNQSSFCFLKKSHDRKSESWKTFLEELKSKDLEPESVIGDGGPGLGAAIKVINWHKKFGIDLFHCLNIIYKALTKKEAICYGLLKDLYGKTNVAGASIFPEFSALEIKANLAINSYDQLNDLFKKIQHHSKLGHPSEIAYISSEVLRIDFQTAAQLLEKFEKEIASHKKIKAAKSYIRNNLAQLILYKQNIELAIKDLPLDTIEIQNLFNLILPIIEFSDQYEKSYEDTAAKKYWADKIICQKEMALMHFSEEEFDRLLNILSRITTKFSRSNSNVENLNNQIRRYLEVYKSIPEWFPSLFSFYWNFRVFTRGKRKGFAPVELLMNGKLKKDWLTLIVENFPYDKIRA